MSDLPLTPALETDPLQPVPPAEKYPAEPPVHEGRLLAIVATPIDGGSPPDKEARRIPPPVQWAGGILLLAAVYWERTTATITIFLLGYGIFLFHRECWHPTMSPAYYEWYSARKVQRGTAGYRSKDPASLIEGGVFVLFFLLGIHTDLVWGTLAAIALAVGLWRLNALRRPAEILEESLRPDACEAAKAVKAWFASPWVSYNLAVLVAGSTLFLFLRESGPLIPFWGRLPSWTALAVGLMTLAIGWFSGSQLGDNGHATLAWRGFFLAAGALILSMFLAAIVLSRQLQWHLLPGDPAWSLVALALVVTILFVRRLACLGEQSNAFYGSGQMKNDPGAAAASMLVIPPLLAVWTIAAWGQSTWHDPLLVGTVVLAVISLKLFLTLVRPHRGSYPAWAVFFAGMAVALLLTMLLIFFGGSMGFCLAAIATYALSRLPPAEPADPSSR